MTLLDVKNLNVSFKVNSEYVKVLRGINLQLESGETLSVIGESGAGKTTLALSIPRLLPDNASVEGRIEVDGQDVLSLTEKEMMFLRRNKMSVIFQEPSLCLIPGVKVGRQLTNVVKVRRGIWIRSEAERIARMYLERVGLDDNWVFGLYPQELSGGMAQRVLVAMALCVEPVIVIADEPTSALDSINQFLILNLIKKLQKELNFGLLLISHDLRIAVNYSDRVIILSNGEIVEEGDTLTVIKNPKHQYTKQLIEAAMRMSII